MVKNYFAEKKHVYRLLSIAMAENGEFNSHSSVSDKEIWAIVTVLIYRYYKKFSESNRTDDSTIFSTIIAHLEGHGINTKHTVDKDADSYIDKLGDFFGVVHDKCFCQCAEMCHQLVLQSLEELENDIDGSVKKSIFMNVDSLSPKSKRQELKEMVYVIRSDESVMDREREAFRVVCKIFKIKNSTRLWKRLVDTKMEDLLTDGKTKCHFLINLKSATMLL